MSKLEELINELCPDGVEYKELGEVIKLEKGKQLNKEQLLEKGEYPAYNGGITYSGFINIYNYTENKIIISQGGASAGFVNFVTTKFYANAHCYVILTKENIVVNKYVYHFLKLKQEILTSKQHGAGIPALRTSEILSIKIPLPPLPIQEEIVRILDIFRELTTELTTELTLRKKQYEYYREKLLTFGDEVERVKLKEVCLDFIVPMRDRPKEFNGDIPWCRIEDIEGKSFNKSLSNLCVTKEIIKKMNLKVFPTGTVICSCSASIGVYAINTRPLITNQTFIGLVCGDRILNKYLLYFMETQTSNLIKLSTTGTIPYISRKKFEDIEIPLPSLEEQERIVAILDKFDTLTNSISEGLPYEIELRKKQYEYYRDKLLTFKKLEKID